MITAHDLVLSEAARLSDDNLRSEILRSMRSERLATTEFEKERLALRISVFRQTLKSRLEERTNHEHASTSTNASTH